MLSPQLQQQHQELEQQDGPARRDLPTAEELADVHARPALERIAQLAKQFEDTAVQRVATLAIELQERRELTELIRRDAIRARREELDQARRQYAANNPYGVGGPLGVAGVARYVGRVG